MFSSISSSGRKGVRSSSGGLTMVPSGSRFPEDFGSKFWSVSTKASQMTGPSMASASSMALPSSELCLAETYGKPSAAASFPKSGKLRSPLSEPMPTSG